GAPYRLIVQASVTAEEPAWRSRGIPLVMRNEHRCSRSEARVRVAFRFGGVTVTAPHLASVTSAHAGSRRVPQTGRDTRVRNPQCGIVRSPVLAPQCRARAVARAVRRS